MKNRTLTLGLLGAALVSFCTGCASSTREVYYWNHTLIEGMTNTDTMTETMSENTRSHRKVIEQDAKGLLDDVDMLMGASIRPDSRDGPSNNRPCGKVFNQRG